ncbi:MAG: hypothetical protein QOF89_5748 [Acidobacteriota bacterium]|jgi:hypothetical protein|nr:hypothetical protein [Acidobacteriota bacterium]
MQRSTLILVALTFAFCSLAAAQKPLRVDLSKEKDGAEPSRFLAVVGDWSIATDDGRKVLLVDGRQWKKGQPAGGLADKARAIYGSRHEEFIDNVKAFAYFPYAVVQGVDDFHDGEISMRFKLVGGALDQCAGILFNLKPNGDYLTVRFNGKEDNLVLWTFEKGKRSFVKKGVKDVHIPFKEWHAMKIVVHGTQLEGWLDREKLLDYTLAAPVAGKVGVWSKTDSISEFADYGVTPEGR